MKVFLSALIVIASLTSCAKHPFATDATNERRLATAQRPIGTGYPLTTQYNMLSMHHWDLLAEKVAAGGSQAMEHFFGDTSVGLYFAPAGTTAFAKTYREALITRFLAYGTPVALSPEGNVVLEIKTEMVGPRRTKIKPGGGVRQTVDPHFEQAKDASGKYRNVPVISEDTGYFDTEEQKAEIQISTSLVHPNGYIFRDSSIFYVEPRHWGHYQHRPPLGDINSKSYSLVNK